MRHDQSDADDQLLAGYYSDALNAVTAELQRLNLASWTQEQPWIIEAMIHEIKKTLTNSLLPDARLSEIATDVIIAQYQAEQAPTPANHPN